MPSLSKAAYDLVREDGCDCRVPLHTEEAFEHGISFQAKYIGTLDIPRPSTRVEIVAAMRRIRYEFKARALKKKKISLVISVEGVKVLLRRNKRKKFWNWDESRLLMQHPIYRIFYVSHDSHDLKIWSYIAREAPSNVFKCNVFKTYKKSQATRVVRTLGQAFEVCNKISLPPSPFPGSSPSPSSDHSGQDSDDDDDVADHSDQSSDHPHDGDHVPLPACDNRESAIAEVGHSAVPYSINTEPHKQSPYADVNSNPTPLYMQMANDTAAAASSWQGCPLVLGKVDTVEEEEGDNNDGGDGSSDTRQVPVSSTTTGHEVAMLQQQLLHQRHQTQAALAQVHLLKDHLAAETAARVDAQARSHQLLLHNRDLLDNVSQLVSRLQTVQMKIVEGGDTTSDIADLTNIPPVPPLPALPTCTFAHLFPGTEPDPQNDNPNLTLGNNWTSHFDVQSPDSGHREMSSDSLTAAAGGAVQLSAIGQNLTDSVDTKVRNLSSKDIQQDNCSSTCRTAVNGASLFSGCFSSSPNKTSVKAESRDSSPQPVTIITPLLLQDPSGNRLDPTTLAAAVESSRSEQVDERRSDCVSSSSPSRPASSESLPRIDPPPRVLRKAQRTSRRSWYGLQGSAGTSPAGNQEADIWRMHIPKSVSDSDYYATSTSRNLCDFGDKKIGGQAGDSIKTVSSGMGSDCENCSTSSVVSSTLFTSSVHGKSSSDSHHRPDISTLSRPDISNPRNLNPIKNELPSDKDCQQNSNQWHNSDLHFNGLETDPDLQHSNLVGKRLHDIGEHCHSSDPVECDRYGRQKEVCIKREHSNLPTIHSNGRTEGENLLNSTNGLNSTRNSKISGASNNCDILAISLSQ